MLAVTLVLQIFEAPLTWMFSMAHSHDWWLTPAKSAAAAVSSSTCKWQLLTLSSQVSGIPSKVANSPQNHYPVNNNLVDVALQVYNITSSIFCWLEEEFACLGSRGKAENIPDGRRVKALWQFRNKQIHNIPGVCRTLLPMPVARAGWGCVWLWLRRKQGRDRIGECLLPWKGDLFFPPSLAFSRVRLRLSFNNGTRVLAHCMGEVGPLHSPRVGREKRVIVSIYYIPLWKTSMLRSARHLRSSFIPPRVSRKVLLSHRFRGLSGLPKVGDRLMIETTLSSLPLGPKWSGRSCLFCPLPCPCLLPYLLPPFRAQI